MKEEKEDWAANCDGCGAELNESEIAYTNDKGDDYCADCWEAIQGDPESLVGTKHSDLP